MDTCQTAVLRSVIITSARSRTRRVLPKPTPDRAAKVKRAKKNLQTMQGERQKEEATGGAAPEASALPPSERRLLGMLLPP